MILNLNSFQKYKLNCQIIDIKDSDLKDKNHRKILNNIEEKLMDVGKNNSLNLDNTEIKILNIYKINYKNL